MKLEKNNYKRLIGKKYVWISDGNLYDEQYCTILSIHDNGLFNYEYHNSYTLDGRIHTRRLNDDVSDMRFLEEIE